MYSKSTIVLYTPTPTVTVLYSGYAVEAATECPVVAERPGAGANFSLASASDCAGSVGSAFRTERARSAAARAAVAIWRQSSAARTCEPTCPLTNSTCRCRSRMAQLDVSASVLVVKAGPLHSPQLPPPPTRSLAAHIESNELSSETHLNLYVHVPYINQV